MGKTCAVDTDDMTPYPASHVSHVLKDPLEGDLDLRTAFLIHKHPHFQPVMAFSFLLVQACSY